MVHIDVLYTHTTCAIIVTRQECTTNPYPPYVSSGSGSFGDSSLDGFVESVLSCSNSFLSTLGPRTGAFGRPRSFIGLFRVIKLTILVMCAVQLTGLIGEDCRFHDSGTHNRYHRCICC